MNHIEVGRENSAAIKLHYEDRGTGRAVVLIPGWPLSEKSWEMQEAVLIAKGYRVITYCRRGFGQSSKPSTGYDYDTFAEDLNTVLTKLDLRDVTLVGFSMGAGEVARYIGTYGESRISQAVFISGITPALLKKDNNKDGVERKVFDDMIKACVEDRAAFMTKFFKDFYSHSKLGLEDVSDEVRMYSWSLAMQASGIATVKSIDAWLEDFRPDIAKITVPSLVIHGSGDKIVPIDSAGARMSKLLKNSKYIEIENGPHGLIMSHAKEVNLALLQFLASAQMVSRVETQLQN